MTNNEFKDLIKNHRKDEDTIALNNGMMLLLKHSANNGIRNIRISLDLAGSFKLPNVSKSVYRKVYRFCMHKHIDACLIQRPWDSRYRSIEITIHSYKDYNRVTDLFQFLNGKKLAKTAKNNNPYMVV